MVFDSANPLNFFTEPLADSLKKSPKRIVFTEGEDDRVLKVAAVLANREWMVPVLLGDVERMKARAGELGLDTSFVRFINPVESPDLEKFESYYLKRERARGMEVVGGREYVANPHNFGAFLMQYGYVDAMLAGNDSLPESVYRALSKNLKPLPKVNRAFSTMVMVDDEEHRAKSFSSSGVLFLADCNFLADPSTEDLARVAIETARLCKFLLGKRPVIGMLSHSTLGSSNTASARKMAAATEMARTIATRENFECVVRGEIQVDVALCSESAERKSAKYPDQPCDVLIFPSLDAGHISYKLLRHVAGFRAYGQVVIGLAGPVAQVARSCDEDRLLGTALLLGNEAIKYHSLFPNGFYL